MSWICRNHWIDWCVKICDGVLFCWGQTSIYHRCFFVLIIVVAFLCISSYFHTISISTQQGMCFSQVKGRPWWKSPQLIAWCWAIFVRFDGCHGKVLSEPRLNGPLALTVDDEAAGCCRSWRLLTRKAWLPVVVSLSSKNNGGWLSLVLFILAEA